jgi:hypothetical protein
MLVDDHLFLILRWLQSTMSGFGTLERQTRPDRLFFNLFRTSSFDARPILGQQREEFAFAHWPRPPRFMAFMFARLSGARPFSSSI